MTVLLLVLACAAVASRAPGISGCESLAGTEREDCRLDEARKMGADPVALDLALAQIPDPVARDLLLVRLAFDTPSDSARYCSRTTTTVGKQRCQQIIGRPHLRSGP